MVNCREGNADSDSHDFPQHFETGILSLSWTSSQYRDEEVLHPWPCLQAPWFESSSVASGPSFLFVPRLSLL